MIRNISKADRLRLPPKKRQQKSRELGRSDGIRFEQLEDRLCLAFVGFFDGGTSTLTLTQSFDDGDVTIDNNGGGGVFQTTDGVGTVGFVAADNLIVNLIDGTGNQLDLDLDNAHNGDVTLNLGDGARLVNFTGTSNAIGGDLAINAGTGAQNVELAINANLNVTGSASFSLGTAFDQIDENAFDITVGSDWNMTDVNRFENNGTMNVGGNVNFDTTADDSTGEFDNDATMNIAGDFNYTGNNMTDNLNTNADFNLTGNYTANVGEGTTNFNINNPNVNIDGDISLTSTDSANVDDLDTVAGATFGGNWTVDLGDGTNNADFFGTFNGTNVDYTGGSGVDTVNYDFSGNPATVNITLGAGDDDFTLGPNASIAPTTLTVDFGINNDTFTNNFGAFTFNASLLGLLGFDYDYDSTTDTLTATEVFNAGAVEFDNNGLNNAWRFNNGGAELTPSANLTVTMIDGTGATLDIDLDFAMAGDLTIDLGDGARTLNFSGFNNSIGGNVDVTAGSDDQTVEIAVNANHSVGGNVTMDLGTGFDVVDEDGNDVAITGDVDFTNVNLFENNGTLTVGGNFSMDTTGETENSEWDNDGTTNITGDFTYNGGDEVDDVFINDGTTIGGNLVANLGDGFTAGGDDQDVNMTLGSNVGGTVTVTSGDSTNGDNFETDAITTFGGDIDVDLGDGENAAAFLGVMSGSSVRYDGGSGSDIVTFGLTGNPSDVNVILGAGDDLFTLEAGAAITPTTLRVDFGGGNDDFINNFGQLTFNANLINLHGFNRFYTVADDMLNMTQLVDTGDITVDNNGTGNAIRLINGTTTEMMPASNVRINLFANTNTNVNVDVDTPLTGNLVLAMSHGARDVMFTGSSNTFGGYVRIEAADGVQNVVLAVNADLNVGNNLIINGRDAADIVDDGANNINVGQHFILRGINLFQNTNAMAVAGNFNMITSLESEYTLLDNDGTMNIGGNLTYMGGDGVDDVLLNVGGVAVGGNVFIDVADANDIFMAQNISLTGGFSAGRLAIFGASSSGGNEVVTDAATTVAGDVTLNFTASTTSNTVILYGTYGGTYGTYRGGSDGDHVTFGVFGNDMTFVNRLNDGNDTFILDATASMLSMVLDFGNGDDTFVDNLGQPYPFPLVILNLP